MQNRDLHPAVPVSPGAVADRGDGISLSIAPHRDSIRRKKDSIFLRGGARQAPERKVDIIEVLSVMPHLYERLRR